MPLDTTFGQTVRVVTWNVWAFDTDRDVRRALITETLRSLRPDVCCLQEVRSDEREDFVAVLGDALGLHVHRSDAVGTSWWRRRLDDPSARVDNVVLSRSPASSSYTLALPGDSESDEQRSAVLVRIAGPDGPLLVVSTQLTSSPAASARRRHQVRALAERLRDIRHADDTLIVAGDMNAEPDSDEVRLLCGHKTAPAAAGIVLLDVWRFAEYADPGWTWARNNPYVRVTGEPDARIDYLFVGETPSGRLPHIDRILVETGSADGLSGSDHYAVVADIRLPRAAALV